MDRDGFFKGLTEWKKTWNEEDAFPLLILRHVATIAGLINAGKTVFRVTKKGETFLSPENAGALNVLLFRTYFRRFNLAFLDSAGPCPALQYAMAYTFLMIDRYAKDWIGKDHFLQKAVLPFVRDELPMSRVSDLRLDSIVIQSRVLEPLAHFGMVEF